MKSRSATDIKLNSIGLSKGVSIAYTDTGGKHMPVILFIHGLANYHSVWYSNVCELSQHFRCICIDLPGNGHSSRNHYRHTIVYYAAEIAEFVQRLDLRNITLAGHSMGGMIAMKMVLANVFAFQKLILFAPAGFEYYSPHESVLFKSAISFGNFLNLDEVQIAQSVRNSFFRQGEVCEQIISDLCDIIQHHDRSAYRNMLEESVHSMLDEDIFSQLHQIPLQTLVLFGENDMLIPNRFLHPVSTREIAEKGTAKMPHARLITYAETGHFVQIERAAEVNQAIIHFMQS